MHEGRDCMEQTDLLCLPLRNFSVPYVEHGSYETNSGDSFHSVPGSPLRACSLSALPQTLWLSESSMWPYHFPSLLPRTKTRH